MNTLRRTCSRCSRYVKFYTTEIPKGTNTTEIPSSNIESENQSDILTTVDEFSQSKKERRRLNDRELLLRWESVKPLMDSYGAYGAEKVTKPHESLHNVKSQHSLTLQHMMDANLHLGHATQLWNPANLPFIFGVRAGIHIINLSIATLPHLRRACAVLRDIAINDGVILFIGTREGMQRGVVSAAKRCNGYHITEKWTPGTLTNAHEILGTRPGATSDTVTKPDIIVIMNPLENNIAIKEATLQRIPTIGVIDTDVNPSCVTYPIPGNDDSTRGIELLLGVLSKAAEEGVQIRKAMLQQQRSARHQMRLQEKVIQQLPEEE